MCVQSEKQRLKKSPATCLGPSPPGLHSETCLHHPAFPQGLFVRKKAPSPGSRLAGPLPLSPKPSTEYDHLVLKI